ncbi:MAG: TetR/AcrR family transcriptional regulator [Pseudomonadota bacterium]
MSDLAKNADARMVRSRAAIVDSSITLLLQNPGASMSEIAVAAGVGRATLYRHFETKEALVQEISLLCLQETEAALGQLDMPELALDQIKLCIVHLMPMANRYSFLLNLWSEASGSAQVDAVYIDQLYKLANMIEQAKVEGSIRADLDTEWIVAHFDGLLNNAWWYKTKKGLSDEAVTQLMINTFLAGVGANEI